MASGYIFLEHIGESRTTNNLPAIAPPCLILHLSKSNRKHFLVFVLLDNFATDLIGSERFTYTDGAVFLGDCLIFP